MSLSAAAVTATNRCRAGDPKHCPGLPPGADLPARTRREGIP